ncbi:flavodoxin family protein [Desulfopila sp. IMCC35008]|uniref:flavodoxin family protein n=1 Tax=Desulfopila sp. IMCC35008 TaxID=2653858 RepID=UPI0013D5B4A3|nr:flavodoxin family protein [Desulfopila sp. IMCC35008]
MHTVIVLGSPRKKGNSEVLVRAIAKGLESTGGSVEYIRLNSLSLRPCQGCGGCDKTGACVIKDDMTDIYSQVDRADRLIVTTPIYFYTVSAQLKIFMDRMQAFWARKYNLKVKYREGEGRKGYLVATAATTGERIFECAELPVRYALDAMGFDYGQPLLVKGVDARGEVIKAEEPLQKAIVFGEQIGAGRL